MMHNHRNWRFTLMTLATLLGAGALVTTLPAAEVAVEVTTLQGETIQGNLDSFTAKSVVLGTTQGSRTIEAENLQELRRVLAGAAPVDTPPELFEVRLLDGSRLRLTKLNIVGQNVQGTHPELGELKLPIAQVRSFRLAPMDAKFDKLWEGLFEKPAKKDLLVIRKQDVLDHLDGVFGTLNDQEAKFQLDGDQLTVKRERIFGVLYARRDQRPMKGAVLVTLLSGDQLAAKQVTPAGGGWKIGLLAGGEVSVPWERLRGFDFAVGKVVYLGVPEARDIRYTPFLRDPDKPSSSDDFLWKVQRDMNLSGGELRLGGKLYARGLALHSRTELRYRLGKEYRRFQAVAGIDDEIALFGCVALRIKGDQKVLYQQEFTVRQAPERLDLDVAGVDELTILVDFGSDESDHGDRLDLVDAKLIK